jgi:hypothetical protein
MGLRIPTQRESESLWQYSDAPRKLPISRLNTERFAKRDHIQSQAKTFGRHRWNMIRSEKMIGETTEWTLFIKPTKRGAGFRSSQREPKVALAFTHCGRKIRLTIHMRRNWLQAQDEHLLRSAVRGFAFVFLDRINNGEKKQDELLSDQF